MNDWKVIDHYDGYIQFIRKIGPDKYHYVEQDIHHHGTYTTIYLAREAIIDLNTVTEEKADVLLAYGDDEEALAIGLGANHADTAVYSQDWEDLLAWKNSIGLEVV